MSVAVIYDHLTRPENTGVYCQRALAELAQVEHFHPSQMAEFPRSGFDLTCLLTTVSPIRCLVV
jgi:hypothetical protein